MKMLLNNKGFSLAEITIAMGLIAMLSVGSLSVLNMDSKSEKTIDKRTDTMMFLSGIGKYFNSGLGCTEFQGATLTAVNQDFPINNYDGYGEDNGGTGTARVITNGFDISRDFSRITSLQFRRKPGSIVIDKYIRATAKLEQTMQITVSVQTALRGEKITAIAPGIIKQYFFEIPVLTNTLNVIESCSVGMSPEEICSALQLVHNNATGICQAAGGSACIFRGTYITLSCAPGPYACAPSWGAVPIMDNPFTGGQSCPPNSAAVQTGNYTSSRSVSCGKKCSVNVVTTENYYHCLDCP